MAEIVKNFVQLLRKDVKVSPFVNAEGVFVEIVDSEGNVSSQDIVSFVKDLDAIDRVAIDSVMSSVEENGALDEEQAQAIAELRDALVTNAEKDTTQDELISDLTEQVSMLKLALAELTEKVENMISAPEVELHEEEYTYAAGQKRAILSEDTSIDLSGKSLSLPLGGFHVQQGVNVVFDGEGEVKVGYGEPASVFALRAEKDSTVLIKNGTFQVAADQNGEGNSCIEAKDGVVTIEGGEFKSDAAYRNKFYILNVVQTQGATGQIIVKGGKFYGQNPAEGDDALGGNYVAEGYKSVKVGTFEFEGAEYGIWEVVPK